MDSARVARALAGGGLVAILGMGRAFELVVLFYVLGLLLTFGINVPVKAGKRRTPPARAPLRDLAEGARAVWRTPTQLAAMILAFQVNLTAFPFTLGLLPYIARDVYATTQAGLGYLVATVAMGGIVASLLLSLIGRTVRPARMVVIFSLVWHALLIAFGQITHLAGGLVLLPLTRPTVPVSSVVGRCRQHWRRKGSQHHSYRVQHHHRSTWPAVLILAFRLGDVLARGISGWRRDWKEDPEGGLEVQGGLGGGLVKAKVCSRSSQEGKIR
jgi:hypothetical protein